MARKIKIINKTPWKTSHLRAFAVRAAKLVFKANERSLRITFYVGRRGDFTRAAEACTGWAYYHSGVSEIGITDVVDKVDLAHTLIHEFGHNIGVKHGEMTGDPFYMRVGNWRERLAWAADMPLEQTAPKVADPVAETFKVIATLEDRLKRLDTKSKRIETAKKKARKRLAYYTKKSLAMAANPKT